MFTKRKSDYSIRERKMSYIHNYHGQILFLKEKLHELRKQKDVPWLKMQIMSEIAIYEHLIDYIRSMSNEKD